MKAFKIRKDNQTFDYRLGKKFNLDKVKKFFENKNYQIIKFLPQQRHICAILSNNLFLKLSTSKGISIVTENEAVWNDAVNKYLNTPKIHDRGYFKNNYFYFISDYIDAPILTAKINNKTDNILYNHNKINEIINLSEKIMALKISKLPADSYNPGKNHQEKFFNKVKLHFQSIPKNIRKKYNLLKLLELIKEKISTLRCKPRHGDFAPWHLIFGDKIFLIDGEHAMSQSVEYYDIGYFIQRVFSVWKNKKLAEKIYFKLMDRKYDKNKLKIIMLARAIGGFLDESLSPKPNYKIHEEFISWILSV